MKTKDGITLITLAVTIVIMLILAGTTINALTGKNGIVARSKEAKEANEEGKAKEYLNFLLDDYNSSNYLQETEDGLTDYLYSLKNKGKFENFLLSDEDTLIIQYKKKYYEVGQNDGFYFVKSVLSEEINKDGKYFIITAKNIKDGKIDILAGCTYIVLDEVSGQNFNFVIPEGEAVTIKILGNTDIDNRGYKRSAIDIKSGATLNLYIYGRVNVDSGYGEDASENIPGKGGYAGIHVPEGATLSLYGSGQIYAQGGNAGNGEIARNSSLAAGGGGAGAGIGGNGGNGGAGRYGVSNDTARVCENGKDGENCGTVNVYSKLSVYAYGGSGGSGGINTYGASGGAGGYPGAGIGGGGAGGAGATCCTGAGGYTGGGASNYAVRANNGKNGGECTRCGGMYWGGGGYFSGPTGRDLKGINVKDCLGGMGGTSYYIGHRAGDGGTAGKGGTVKISSTCKVYAYNGNRYTDGTSYRDGLNQCPIYLQSGISTAKYVVKTYSTHDSSPHRTYGLTNGITLGQVSSLNKNKEKLSYKNPAYETAKTTDKIITMNEVLKNINMESQGIGSGAGYIELSNGSFSVDNSMN